MDYDKYLNGLQSQLEHDLEDMKNSLEQQMQAFQSSCSQNPNHVEEQTTQSKFCPECGTKAPADAKFCSNCGCKFESEPADDFNAEIEPDEDETFECPICFDDFEGWTYVYRYESNGVEVEREVIVACAFDALFYMGDEGLELSEEDFQGCQDVDDCGVVIARHVIKDNDGEVRMTFTHENNDEDTLTEVPYEIVLDKNLNYPKTDDDDCWTLSLGANCDMAAMSCEIFELEEEDVERVQECIDNEDSDELFDCLAEYDGDIYEILNLWGDEETERLSYELTDSDGETMEEGDLYVSERNVFQHPDSRPPYGSHNHPEYLLLKTDIIKRSWSSFSVPAHFAVGGIHFYKEDLLPVSGLESLGDTVTTHFSIRFAGKTYHGDADDAGTYGDIRFYLCKWNDEWKWYEVIGEM